MMCRKNKQQGVVLLSCLIFLLLLLTLLRFNLNSTAMQEMKAGADYDQLTAQETSMRVMAEAELNVLNNFGALTGDLESKENLTKMMTYWTGELPTGVLDGDNGANFDWNEAHLVEVKKDGKTQVLGEYVIERFMGNGPVLEMGDKEKDTVILRITARGYGAGDLASKDNRIYSTLQNTYILSKAN